MASERVSVRQAVVVLPATAASLTGAAAASDAPADRLALVRAAVLDVIGALVRVDGTTLAVIAPPTDAELALLADLPAGIEVVAPARPGHLAWRPERLLPAALQALIERRFDRVLGVAGDVVGLTPRVVATALSALGEAEVVVGPTAGGAGYLIGVRAAGGVAALSSPGGGAPFGGAALLELARTRSLVARRVEPLPRISELTGRPALVAAVAREPALAPRLAAWLAGPDAAPNL